MGIGASGVAENPNFATTLYTGNGTTQSIVTGKNNAAGSLTWIKNRSGAGDNFLFDTLQGTNKYVRSNSNRVQTSLADTLTSFNSNGFDVGISTNTNNSGTDYVAWTFLEETGFFDVVNYTGNGSSQNISHNLNDTVGCLIVKDLTGANNWGVWHRSLSSPTTKYLRLNTFDAEISDALIWNSTNPTSSQFTIGNSILNTSGNSIVAYLFAHNISKKIACDGFNTDLSGNASVTIGFEPKWLLTKDIDGNDNWSVLDVVRGWAAGNDANLSPNTSSAESNATNKGEPNATGFSYNGGSLSNYIYVAIG